jgi:hypothetical protein
MNPSNWSAANLAQVVVALAEAGAALERAEQQQQPQNPTNEQVAQ